MEDNQNLRALVAIRLANKIVDNLKFAGATRDDNLAQHLFDRLSDALLGLTDTELLEFTEGIRDYRLIDADNQRNSDDKPEGPRKIDWRGWFDY